MNEGDYMKIVLATIGLVVITGVGFWIARKKD